MPTKTRGRSLRIEHTYPQSGTRLITATRNPTPGDAWIVVDSVGIVVDAVAVALPLVPGGAGLGVRALRGAEAGRRAAQGLARGVDAGLGFTRTLDAGVQVASTGIAVSQGDVLGTSLGLVGLGFRRGQLADLDALAETRLYSTIDVGVSGTIADGVVRARRASRNRSAAVLDDFAVSVPQSAVRSNAQLVDDIGTRAGQWAGRSRQQTSLAGLTAREVGTQQHSYAKRLLDRYQRIYGDRGLSTEVRYFEGSPLLRGRTPKGSIRLDVVEGDIFSPTAIYDYKFGTSGLSTGRINQIRTGAGLSPNIPVIEVRP